MAAAHVPRRERRLTRTLGAQPSAREAALLGREARALRGRVLLLRFILLLAVLGTVDVGSARRARLSATVAACGLAQGADFPATVMPFILRGVTLRGIDSVMLPKAPRIEAWNRLAQDLDPAVLEAMTQEISLDQLVATAEAQMKGQVRGRTIVNPNS